MAKLHQLKFRKYVLFLTLITLLISIPTMAGAAEEKQDYEFEKFNEVLNEILENYVEDVDLEKIEDGAIKGMLEALDPHSKYFTKNEYQGFQESTEGTFGGVGMRIEKVGEYVQVTESIPETPAEKAGIQAGDKIVKVGIEDVKGYSLEDVTNLIKGEPGTQVVLTVSRDGMEKMPVFTITRDIIDLGVVEKEMLENNIGYINLRTFSTFSVREFRKALLDLQIKGAEGLILDLRNNPGGYLGSALSIASIFIDEEKELVHVVSKDEEENTYWSTNSALDMPLVALINGGSASGSEIVAGAIQDHGVGVLVGTQSYGKASVQTVKTLQNGAAYKFTTAKYLTPNKNDINGIGLTPDYVVENPEKQLQKAIKILKQGE